MAFRWRWLLISFALILGGGPLFAAPKEQSAYAVAVADFRNEMWSRAETEFAQFRQKYPESTNAPEAVLLQAQAAFKQGKSAVASALLADPIHLARAGTLADQYVYWTGEAQFQNGDFANAAETWVALAQKFPESRLRLHAVVGAAAAFGQITNWLQVDDLLGNTNGVFQRAARLDPGNALVVDGWLSLENSKYQRRDFPGVVAVYERLTNQWPLLSQARQCQGTYLFYQAKMESGDFAAALAAATNLVRIASAPANQEWLATGWASQGEALERMGRLPEAILAWRNNLTNAPVAQEREAILKKAELEIVQGQLTNAWESLTNFLGRFAETNVADIALLTAGELHLKDYAARPAATNQLSAARDCFDQLLRVFTNSPLAGKAHLDRGWCGWFAKDMTNSLADFSAATRSPDLPPEDLAVARFKMGDAMFALTNYMGATNNYQAVLDDFTNFPAVAKALGDRALYQMLRANLELTNMDGASNALAQILEQFPASNLAPDSALLYGEGLADARQPAAAREQFQKFEAEFPDSPLRPQVEFAIARTYEREQKWPAAIAGYQDWLDHFPTNQPRPEVFYALALANSRAGSETNAFDLFTNFVAQFPASNLAPQARWWVADHFFNEADYVDAEKNYELVYVDFPTNHLANPARLMAGQAAVARQDYKGANKYFRTLEEDTNCPVPLRAQAAFAHGNALMSMDSTDTNNLLANFPTAVNVFAQIGQWDPTNQLAARAEIKIGDCYFQLSNYDDATSFFRQVVSSTNAGVSARSEAQFKIGATLEKMAATLTGTNQTAALEGARDNYADVFDSWTGNDLRTDEVADEFWIKEAGLQAAAVAENLGNWEQAAAIYGRLKTLLPQLGDSLDKKIADANSHLPDKRN